MMEDTLPFELTVSEFSKITGVNFQVIIPQEFK
jgi:hypothetical protein